MAPRGLLALLLSATFILPIPVSRALVPHDLGNGSIHPTKIASRVLALSANEIRGETISTGPDEVIQVLFADGTTLTVGHNAEATIDSFVFNPADNTARLTATLARGVFRFIGGRTTQTPDGVSLRTPFGTLSVGRASADISLGGNGQPPHFDLVFGSPMTLSQGGAELARVRQPGYSIAPQPGGGQSASVKKTPAEWRTAIIDELP